MAAHAAAEQSDAAQAARTAEAAVAALRSKMEVFRKADETELLKLLAVKEAAFDDLEGRLDAAWNKILAIGGGMSCMAGPLQQKESKAEVEDDTRGDGDLIPAVHFAARPDEGQETREAGQPLAMDSEAVQEGCKRPWAMRAVDAAPRSMREGLAGLEEALRKEMQLASPPCGPAGCVATMGEGRGSS